MKEVENMERIIFTKDKYDMNWLREDCEYAKTECPKELACEVHSQRDGDILKTSVIFTNTGCRPVFTSLDSIGIYMPLNDRYEGSEICIKERCHTHIFCGGDISYIMALRMGGEAPHLGMVLTEGSLGGYSIKRDFAKMSNDRGLFILHPSPAELQPGESMKLAWTIFPHEGKEDFYRKLAAFPGMVLVSADRYVCFPEETVRITVRPSFDTSAVLVNGMPAAKTEAGFIYDYHADACGEQILNIEADQVKTYCRLLVQENLQKLAGKRCRFIAGKQQYNGDSPMLRGSFLAYDNEEKHVYYSDTNDYNGGRERVGMGLLMARYLQRHEDAQLRASLDFYTEFVLRELVDAGSGEVYNDVGRDGSYERLYNMPWYATLFTELYQLDGKREHLLYAYRILMKYYSKGGHTFYAIELPVLAVSRALRAAGMEEELLKLTEMFKKHADYITEIGTAYPPSEVNYEQSIVAPAANILLQVHILTGDEVYRKAGESQLKVLELFNGLAPDFHLYETAIRHWDGYWFGKRKLYGDTFPHYWSGLTGNVYALYSRITGSGEYKKKAMDSVKGVLPLLFPDGSASCACLFPHSVNGIRADFYDPYANDQDWGLYFLLRLEAELGYRFEDSQF